MKAKILATYPLANLHQPRDAACGSPYSHVFINDLGGFGCEYLTEKSRLGVSQAVHVIFHGGCLLGTHANRKSLQLSHNRAFIANEKASLKAADSVIFPTNFSKSFCERKLQSKVKAAKVLRWPYAKPKGLNKKSSGGGNDIAFYGMLHTRKGIDLFLKALESMINKANWPYNSVIFVGPFGFHDGQPAVNLVMEFHKMFPEISIAAFPDLDQSQAIKLLQKRAATIVIPARLETFGYGLLDVVMCTRNKKIIASDIPAFKELTNQFLNKKNQITFQSPLKLRLDP